MSPTALALLFASRIGKAPLPRPSPLAAHRPLTCLASRSQGDRGGAGKVEGDETAFTKGKEQGASLTAKQVKIEKGEVSGARAIASTSDATCGGQPAGRSFSTRFVANDGHRDVGVA